MKIEKCILFIAALVAGNAQASLFDRGGGLVYDNVLDVTWIQDANYSQSSGFDSDGLLTHAEAVMWTENLNYGGYTNWRLPNVDPINGSYYVYEPFTTIGATDIGYGITSPYSEMSYMYYVNLGNIGGTAPGGGDSSCYISESDTCLKNSGSFVNLMPGIYWSGSKYPRNNLSFYWYFATDIGYQHALSENGEFYVWAVRDGDVTAIPEPKVQTLLFVGLGLIILFKHKTLARYIVCRLRRHVATLLAMVAYRSAFEKLGS